MIEYSARGIAGMSLESVWQLPDTAFRLVFDDGVLETNARATIFSRYTWEIHAMFPNTPLLVIHHIGEQRLSPKTHLDLLSEIIWDCRDTYEKQGIEVDMELLSRMAYQITNKIYNDFTRKLEAYVATISALDFIEAMDQPVIDAANKRLASLPHAREADISAANEEIRRVLFDKNELATNGVSKAVRASIVSDQQALQCVGSRGYATDIGSRIFHDPIVPGFAQGITLLRDHMMESRSASVAALNSKDPMQKSEYMNRNIQLSAATLSNLNSGDCGSRDYLPLTIANKDILRDMLGMFYIDEETGEEKPIRRRQSRHLIGKTLKFRTIFTCKHPDRYGFCARCLGEIAQSIPRDTNIGHVSASELQSRLSQLLLSTKHLLASARAERIVISDHDLNYITTGKGENNLYLVQQLKNRKYRVVIGESEAQNLPDVIAVSTVEHLIPSRMSELTYIAIEFSDTVESLPVLIQVSSGSRKAALSRAMLQYIKTTGWTINEAGNYVVDMAGWNHDQPFVELPVRHFSSVDYMLTIASFIKGGDKGQGRSIMKCGTPAAALQSFHDLVSAKMQVPLSYLQVIIMSTMVQDERERNYHLPLPRETGTPAHYQSQMRLRSLAAAMAFQGHYEVMVKPESYLVKDRPKHPLDFLLMG